MALIKTDQQSRSKSWNADHDLLIWNSGYISKKCNRPI